MKRPAVFFDRDNTLIVSDGYLGDPERVVLMDGAADAIARARSLGFATVVVSNQSGVARGMFDEEAVHAVNERMDRMLADQNRHAVIDRHEFCPYHPDATVERYRQDSDLRKPRAGMILEAAEKLALDLSRSWLIGDAPRDIEAGRAAGCRTILFTPSGVAASPAASASAPADAQPDHSVTSLIDAIEYIAQHPATGGREGEEDSVQSSGLSDAEQHRTPLSIPQHPHLPSRVESAARVD
ncbi:MAG: HAD family hydrolase, partial [Tepidisphaeraceae bacterium]